MPGYEVIWCVVLRDLVVGAVHLIYYLPVDLQLLVHSRNREQEIPRIRKAVPADRS